MSFPTFPGGGTQKQATPVSPTGVQAAFFGIVSTNPHNVAYWPPFFPVPHTFYDAIWSTVETAKGVYNWANFDLAVNRIVNAGGQPYYSFGSGVPSWAGPASVAPPTDLQDLSDYVTQVAMRFAGKIKFYEVWNEPDTASYTGDVDTLVSMAQRVYNAVKAVDAAAIVLAPACVKLSGQTYLTNFLAAGGGAYADAMNFHGYAETGDTTPAESLPGIIAGFQSVFSAAGYGRLDQYCSEIGLSGATDTAHAAYLAKIFLLAWPTGIKHLQFYNWDVSNSHKLWAKATGMDGAGIAYQEVRKWMLGADVAASSTAGNIWSIPITRPSGYSALAVWDATGASSSYSVPSQYTQYRGLDGTVNAVVGGTVTLGIQPILLETGSVF